MEILSWTKIAGVSCWRIITSRLPTSLAAAVSWSWLTRRRSEEEEEIAINAGGDLVSKPL